MGWEAITILAAAVIIDLMLRLAILPRVLTIFEQAPALNAPQVPPDPDAIPVTTRTADGVTLSGSFFLPLEGEPVGTIVFYHEFGGDHHSASWYCAPLRTAGFAIVAFDFRGHGESEALEGYTPLHWLTDYEVDDALAALDFVDQHDDLHRLPLGVLGISRGGGAALAAAARRRNIAAVACEGAFSTDALMMNYATRWMTVFVPEWVAKLVPNWHIRGTLLITRLVSQFRRNCHYTWLEWSLPRLADRHLLLVADGADSYVDLRVTRRLCAAAGHSAEDIWVAPKAKHNQARKSDPVAFDAKLLEFFVQIADSATLESRAAELAAAEQPV